MYCTKRTLGSSGNSLWGCCQSPHCKFPAQMWPVQWPWQHRGPAASSRSVLSCSDIYFGLIPFLFPADGDEHHSSIHCFLSLSLSSPAALADLWGGQEWVAWKGSKIHKCKHIYMHICISYGFGGISFQCHAETGVRDCSVKMKSCNSHPTSTGWRGEGVELEAPAVAAV